jgi:Heparinase II/III N-terminus/Heparinase II/III-like protein
MSIKRKIRRALRGRVSARAALLEAGRRGVVALRERRERASLARSVVGVGEAPARLASGFARASGAQLLEHFRSRTSPRFFEGFGKDEGEPASAELIEAARATIAHRWPLLGYGTFDFGREIDWLREPASGVRWPLEYGGDVALVRGDGSDVRVLWELNRLGHLLVLARAYAATRDEVFAEEFFAQVESWRARNPTGFGPNWACAMEVALRATNLLAAFEVFRSSEALDEQRLAALLSLFDAHGRHVRRHLEYSYIATGNHYLSDVTGLLWLGLCLPELAAARAWRDFALKELRREMDAQVLADGADGEASTGYHRFVTELFIYSFILCRANGFELEERHRARLRSMLEYLRAYLRPDGRAPLVGDADGGQLLPLVRRDADDHAYLLALGAALFREPRFKLDEEPATEVSLLLGAEGERAYRALATGGLRASTSSVFMHAGACVLRDGDLYLLLNASGAGLGGRGAHGHNDALSIEVSACGTSFITDPGTYVYTADLRARAAFRSTAYHSTVEVDGIEQNTTEEAAPFVLGDESRPRITRFETGRERDVAAAEHRGYERLRGGPVTHRRTVTLDRARRLWLVEDRLEGAGAHDFRFVFHAAPGLEVVARGACVELRDAATDARLFIVSLEGMACAEISPRFSSHGYGSKRESAAAVWTLRARAPLVARWLLVPVCAGEDERARLELTREMVSGE